MLLLIMMLLMGLAAGVCGFMACFLPARWYRLTESISLRRPLDREQPETSASRCKISQPGLWTGDFCSGLLVRVHGCYRDLACARWTGDKPSAASGQRGASQHSNTGDHCAFDLRGRSGHTNGRFPGKGTGGLWTRLACRAISNAIGCPEGDAGAEALRCVLRCPRAYVIVPLIIGLVPHVRPSFGLT